MTLPLICLECEVWNNVASSQLVRFAYSQRYSRRQTTDGEMNREVCNTKHGGAVIGCPVLDYQEQSSRWKRHSALPEHSVYFLCYHSNNSTKCDACTVSKSTQNSSLRPYLGGWWTNVEFKWCPFSHPMWSYGSFPNSFRWKSDLGSHLGNTISVKEVARPAWNPLT